MKKILIIGVFIMGLMFVGCTNKSDKEEPKKVETRRLMELDEYKNISLDNLKISENINQAKKDNTISTTVHKNNNKKIMKKNMI